MKISSFDAFFESEEKRLTASQEAFLNSVCKLSGSTWSYENGLVNVSGSFDASYNHLKDLNGIKFGIVDGDFDISDNELTTLEGSPEEVTGDFLCASNFLNSLEGGPRIVRGHYHCSNNDLFDLTGLAKGIHSLTALGNSLENIEGCPKMLTGDFFIASNFGLNSLVGGPQVVDGDYDCSSCALDSLEGAPEKVGGFFNCSNNNLETLKGGPKEVGGIYNCTENDLQTLEGLAEKIGRTLAIGGNEQLIDLSNMANTNLDPVDNVVVGKLGLPPELVKFQLDFIKQNKSGKGWLKAFIQSDYKKLPQIFNRQDSESGRKILDGLKLIEFSYESPETLAQIVKFFPDWDSLIVSYFKDNKEKFSPDFQEASGLYLDLKDLGF
jgi:hypothetical protein